mmetsp:Transcript_28998/g.40114  ORF Transcript_28998/g.40114 Transcript_28998/m.40114 type:complete len:86 (+) Transcript_28998:333-590(+)
MAKMRAKATRDFWPPESWWINTASDPWMFFEVKETLMATPEYILTLAVSSEEEADEDEEDEATGTSSVLMINFAHPVGTSSENTS